MLLLTSNRGRSSNASRPTGVKRATAAEQPAFETDAVVDVVDDLILEATRRLATRFGEEVADAAVRGCARLPLKAEIKIPKHLRADEVAARHPLHVLDLLRQFERTSLDFPTCGKRIAFLNSPQADKALTIEQQPPSLGNLLRR